MDKQLVSFSVADISSFPTLEQINDTQFMKVRLRCFSDGITRHLYGFSLDAVKEAAFTLLGKPLLFKYSLWEDDASGHEPDEVQCGFVPKDELDADISFEYDESLNKTFCCVNAYIWKVYQEDLSRILERDNGYKNVSVEMWLIAYDPDAKKDLGYIPVSKFCYTGITILGESLTEACEGADMRVMKFSTEEYEKAQKEFIKQLNNSINLESHEDSFLIHKNVKNKEVTMAKELENAATGTPEVLENGEKRSTVSVSVSEYTSEYDDNGNYIGGTDEYHAKSETTVEKTSNDTSVELNNTTEEKCSKEDNPVEEKCSDPESVKCSYEELEQKYTLLESELGTLKNSFRNLEIKCSSLESYKNNKEKAERDIAIECAINDVTGVLTTDEIDQWRTKALNCASADSFINELKAFAYDKQKKSGVKPEESLRNAIPVTPTEIPENVWERLAHEVKLK